MNMQSPPVALRTALYLRVSPARQDKADCKGRAIPMGKLDHLVADHIGDRLLQPKRLETMPASVIDGRQERVERRRAHLAGLNRRIIETDQRIGRLFDAIEGGMIDKDDAMAKERMASLKALRDQAVADAERTQLALNSSGDQGVTPTCSRHLPARRVNGYGSTMAAIIATT